MLGIGCVVIVNSVFTDLGFFISELGNGVEFLIPLALNVPQVLGQLAAIKYLSIIPIKATVIATTLIAALLSGLTPIVMLLPSHNTRLAIILAFMVYFGLFMAIANSAFTGYVSSI